MWLEGRVLGGVCYKSIMKGKNERLFFGGDAFICANAKYIKCRCAKFATHQIVGCI